MGWQQVLETAGDIASIVVALAAIAGGAWLALQRGVARARSFLSSPTVIRRLYGFGQALAVGAVGAIVLLVAIRFIESSIDDRVAGTETVILGQVQALREQLATTQTDARTPGAEIDFANNGNWGTWSEPRFCSAGQYVCGMRQKVERNQGNGDDSAMNAIAFYCCPLAPGAQVEAEPEER